MEFYGFDKNKENVREQDPKDKDKDKEKGEEKDEEKENLNRGGMDMNEAYEKDMEEKLENSEEGNNRMADNVIQRIEYDMRNNKKEIRLKLKDKIEMEKMRRWEVKIYNVYITPMREMLDPFIQFTVGGDYSVQVFSNKKGDSYKVPSGMRGFADKTEVLRNVDALERKPFDRIITTEVRMSYSMINSQKMMVELWDYNTLWMNTIMGYSTVNLIDVVNGNMCVSVDISKKIKKRKRPQIQASIDFKCIFQEIWDYKINFLNWRCENILSPRQQKDPKADKPNLQISIELENRAPLQPNSLTKSEVLKNCLAPQFSNFDEVLLYRGTSLQLENENLVIKLIAHKLLYSQLLSTKTVNLQGILEFERIKTDFPMVDPISKDKYNVKLEGSLSIDCEAKYEQTGDNTTLISTKKYMCINIQRVENIRPAETRGIVDSFISVEYSGISMRTRTVKENNNPTFNEVLYFMIPLKEEYLKDIDKYTQKINEEFANKNEVVFNLMIEGDDNTYDNLGISHFHLSELKTSGNATTKQYFADDLKKNKRYVTRVYTGKLKLLSAFSLSNNTFVNFEAWFLDDFPDTIDFGQKKGPNEIGDKIPLELSPFLGNTKEKDFFYEKFKKQISYLFRQYTNYSYKERSFFEVYQMDQYKVYHLLPYYLSSISLPNKNFTLSEVSSNPLFFDYNLTSLDEIAHYVRCFSINLESKGEVWSSPNYMVKIRKGGVEDHAILMACLMMGLKVIKKAEISKEAIAEGMTPVTKTEKTNTNTNNPKNENKTNTPLEGTTKTGKEKIENLVTDIFPYENRVFVCIGKLKYTRNRHVWVMTIGDDYRDVTFWDSKLNLKFNLFGRIDEPEKLRNFLLMNYADYDAIKQGITDGKDEEEEEEESEESIKKDKNDFEDKVLPFQNDSAIIKYEEDDYKDNILNEHDILLQNYEDALINEKNKNLKQALPVQADEYMLLGKDEEGGKKKISFLEQQRQEMEAKLQAESDQFFLPVDEFKDRSGKTVTHTALPYATLDIIFNKNNIFANRQYHDPAHIKYNLYQKKEWIPYCHLKEEKIWRNKFQNFYSMMNFGSAISPGLIVKMTNALVKEVRVGIAAARSGMNLQTRFKKKNEQVNLILRNYLDLIEDLALARISDKKFKVLRFDWKEAIKTKIPKFYRMEAKTLYYNYYDLEGIRRNMTEDIETFFNSKIKNLMFATSGKVYPYINQVVSIRIILAKFYRIAEEDILPEHLKEYKEDMAQREQAIKEEEDSFDDEMEEEEATAKAKEELTKKNEEERLEEEKAEKERKEGKEEKENQESQSNTERETASKNKEAK